MKTINVQELRKKIKEYIDMSQKDCVVLTRQGKPSAVLVGVKGKDWKTVVLETNAKFWYLVRRRRRQKTLSLDDMRKHLKLDNH